MIKKRGDLKDLKITIECGKVSAYVSLDKREVREMMRYWKFPSFMKKFEELLVVCKNKFLGELLK